MADVTTSFVILAWIISFLFSGVLGAFLIAVALERSHSIAERLVRRAGERISDPEERDRFVNETLDHLEHAEGPASRILEAAQLYVASVRIQVPSWPARLLKPLRFDFAAPLPLVLAALAATGALIGGMFGTSIIALGGGAVAAGVILFATDVQWRPRRGGNGNGETPSD